MLKKWGNTDFGPLMFSIISALAIKFPFNCNIHATKIELYLALTYRLDLQISNFIRQAQAGSSPILHPNILHSLDSFHQLPLLKFNFFMELQDDDPDPLFRRMDQVSYL
jgi:hypothetical protein